MQESAAKVNLTFEEKSSSKSVTAFSLRKYLVLEAEEEEQRRNFLEENCPCIFGRFFLQTMKYKMFQKLTPYFMQLCISKMRPQRKCSTEFESFYICSHLHLICISLTVSLAPNFNLKQVAADAFSI